MNRGTLKRIPSKLVIQVLYGYHQWISPFLGNVCRFYPSCSVYAMEVIASFGLLKGGWLSIKRVCKCQPFHPGGVDLPPKPSR